jgi:hypothetical protein
MINDVFLRGRGGGEFKKLRNFPSESISSEM